jgi:hypothetical protein
MNCLRCNYRNPGTVGYCQKCGAKMDFTADEIAEALAEKGRQEVVQATGFHAKRLLTFAVILFLVSVTLLVLSGGAPEGKYSIPSAANGSKYVELDASIDAELPRPLAPLEVKRK